MLSVLMCGFFLLFRCPLRGWPAMIGVAARLPREPGLRHRHRPDFEGIATPPSRCALTPAGATKAAAPWVAWLPNTSAPRWGVLCSASSARRRRPFAANGYGFPFHAAAQPVLRGSDRTAANVLSGVRVSRTDAHLGFCLPGNRPDVDGHPPDGNSHLECVRQSGAQPRSCRVRRPTVAVLWVAISAAALLEPTIGPRPPRRRTGVAGSNR